MSVLGPGRYRHAGVADRYAFQWEEFVEERSVLVVTFKDKAIPASRPLPILNAFHARDFSCERSQRMNLHPSVVQRPSILSRYLRPHAVDNERVGQPGLSLIESVTPFEHHGNVDAFELMGDASKRPIDQHLVMGRDGLEFIHPIFHVTCCEDVQQVKLCA